MKNLLNKTALAIVLLSLTSCSIESVEQELTNDNSLESTFSCTNSHPEARLTNNGTINFSFKVYDENFNLIVEQLNVAPGSSTNWSSFPEGNVIISLENDVTGVSEIKKEILMSNCTVYDVTVATDNTLGTNQPISL
ncbi:hypothetical protein [uncultured Lacinutrix sp.]|uniref:hypothetical protein n=1 Tax=uncultured Lacinutrix sp. TaxID=574032 RepID=UPI00261F8897|nr:hypothetical protein [uncultured Lacinutrix sp.]